MRDLVPFVLIKKREKYQWRGVAFSKVAGRKSKSPPWAFFTFLKYILDGAKFGKRLISSFVYR